MYLSIYDKERDSTGTIHIWSRHVVSYLYQKEFGEPYTLLNCSCHENGMRFVRDIEYKWWHNQIDEWELRNSQEFKEFILENYDDEMDFPTWSKPWYEEEEEARQIASEWEDYD